MKNYLFKSSFVCMLLLFATVAFGRSNDLMHNIANSDIERYQNEKPIDFCNTVIVSNAMFHRVCETEQVAVITYSFTIRDNNEITITNPVRKILSVFSDTDNVEYLKRLQYSRNVKSDKIYKRPIRITV